MVSVLAYEYLFGRGEWAKYTSLARLQQWVEGHLQGRIACKYVQHQKN